MKRCQLVTMGVTALVLLTANGCQRNKSSGIVTIDGFELPYFVEGTGVPCMVINDAPAMKRVLSGELRNHFKFIFMDPRMNAPYDKSFPIEKIMMNTLVDDIEQVRRTVGLDKTYVLGHSISGIVALEYVRKYPEHTLGVIMNGTPPFWDERVAEARKSYWEAEASQERKEIYRQNWEDVTTDSLTMKDSYILDGPRGFHNPRYDCSWILKDESWNEEIWYQVFNVIMTDYDLAKSSTVKTPVFLSLGKSDYLVPYYLWDDEKEKLPNLSYNLFEKSGHWAMLEEQALFDSLLIDWIKGK